MTDHPPYVVNPEAVGDPNQTPIVRLWPAAVSGDTTTADLIALGRDIWGDRRIYLADLPVLAAVIVGDLARIARTHTENGHVDNADLEREVGNLILSATRWADDLGLNPDQCIAAAAAAQRAYVARLEARHGR